jgi:hypothetical protein
MRKNHVIGGLIIFGLGLFLAYFYSPYIVEVLKGALQPILILFGLVAFAAGIFGRNTFKKMNFIVAAAFLFLGIYGLYDEYYAVVDFFNGLIPPLLIILGLVSVVHGIRTLT